ncbi:MAG: hypothetical protein LBD01_05715 [Puniceicoccales bacterium]|jgi:hypothetical protein|nr:hypothetical protein [Puniceicoccales bacterium]
MKTFSSRLFLNTTAAHIPDKCGRTAFLPFLTLLSLLALALVTMLSPTTLLHGATGDEMMVPVPQAVLDTPLSKQRIVFVTRHQYASGHHNTETFFPSAKNEHNSGKYNPGGSLKIMDFKIGKVTTLLETTTGVIRDPEVHFDGKKILFSMRKNKADSYHIYEINTDGTALRQLTHAKDVDDIDPFYLADDHIAFSSTREPKYCGCNKHIMANLYRMEPDGTNIYQISKNPLFDGHGVLMPDGRILYDRWEYVDRNFGDAQGIWTSNPDGTNHALYWGNNTPSPGGVIDARPIPGTNKIVSILTSTHDRPWGALAIIDRRLGLEGPKPVLKIWPESAMKDVWESDKKPPHYGIDNMKGIQQKYEDPYPIDEQNILCAKQIKRRADKTGLYLLDIQGNETLLYSEEKYGCYDPMPIAPRKRPPLLSTRRNFTDTTGRFYVLDVYNGTHMQGVKHGDVKQLRIIEIPEKRHWSKGRWSGQGSVYPAIAWDDFQTKRVLGVVPVNANGSAYFEVPSEAFLYFQLLDKDGRMIQSMRSGTYVQPGEQNGCIGCHDDRLTAVASSQRDSLASILRGRPAVPQLPVGETKARNFSYREKVQPIFDKNCIRCHNPDKRPGEKLNLTGGTGQVFNPSYAELWGKKYIAPVGAGPARILEARTWGASQSRLIKVLSKPHAGIELDAESLEILNTWIDINAPYYPSYSTSYPDNPYGRSPLTQAETNQLKTLLSSDIAPNMPDRGGNTYYVDKSEKLDSREKAMIWAASALNFDEPEKSLALKAIKDKEPGKYARALEIIKAGNARLKQNGPNDIDGFKACPMDLWREEKYQVSRQREAANRKSIIAGEKRPDDAAP